ncbi:radical SAM family heme chaperone HemW [Gynurincola endophyticus]|uniref:radical SAM family heme chaperone HemW n=1 Tax=Gynurincola endophyticus TaxID=2479004 RepID=UPI000F8F5B3C|nr:radical SAM family heme chaperone HemW [Gynurincola endophyticus]
MAGIYLHIPFCKQACHYCNFHFSTSLKQKPAFVEALLKEIELRKDYLQQEVVKTVYFGGGTPSLLSTEELTAILDQLHRHFTITADAEITLETNPDNIQQGRLQDWKKLGINRLSIGIQSFFEEDLQWMNRAHNAAEALKAVELARSTGFENLTVDLIYGTPTLSEAHWKWNVDRLIEWKIPHISCYALTVEPKTALDHLIHTGKFPNVDPQKQADHFLLLMKWLKTAGYEHYEISNFALPGHRSKHNSAYWQSEHYIGLGPSAHSFNTISRQWNIANNAIYIKEVKNGGIYWEKETLTHKDVANEYIMTALRTTEGIHYKKIASLLTTEEMNSFTQLLLSSKWKQYFIQSTERIALTDDGKLFADAISSDLFFE